VWRRTVPVLIRSYPTKHNEWVYCCCLHAACNHTGAPHACNAAVLLLPICLSKHMPQLCMPYLHPSSRLCCCCLCVCCRGKTRHACCCLCVCCRGDVIRACCCLCVCAMHSRGNQQVTYALTPALPAHLAKTV
jgi:hypothetical protein